MSLSIDWMAVAEFLGAWTAKTTVVLGLGWGATLLLRRQSAALRRQIWAIAILASLALPFASAALPSWHVVTAQRATAFPHPAGVAAVRVMDAEPLPVPAARAFNWDFLVPVVMCAWAAGASLLSLRLFAGIASLSRDSTYSKATVAAQHVLDGLRKEFGVRSAVALLESASASTMPMTWGFLRPRIVLPAGASEWSEQRRRIVLSHELAHVSRGDWVFQICADLLRASLWFHPLAWLAARCLRQESERASDDAVLNSGIAAQDYASELLAITQALTEPGRQFSLALAIVRHSNLERRFAAMLNSSLRRGPLSHAKSISLTLFAASFLLPLAALTFSAAASADRAVAASIAPVTAAPLPQEAAPYTAAVGNGRQASMPAASMGQIAGSYKVEYAAALTSKSPANKTAEPQAANNTASVEGVVLDPSGAVIPGATVDLVYESDPAVPSGELATGQAGEFSFPHLVPGSYTLTIRRQGLQPYTAQHIQLLARERLNLHQLWMRAGKVSIETTVRSDETASAASTPEADCSASPAPAVAIAPAPPSAPARVRVGSDFEVAALVCRTEPVYPAIAKKARVQGTVVLNAIIGKDGSIQHLNFVSGPSLLMQAALDAVRNWRYTPLVLYGQPVEVQTEISLVFTLPD